MIRRQPLKDALAALARWQAAGRPIVPEPELTQRRASCAACPSRWPPAAVPLLCGECGCILAGKLRMATESCPLDRWPTYAEGDVEFETPEPRTPNPEPSSRCCGRRSV